MTVLEIATVRAAEYVRMSTESQQYSITNQQAAIREYADEHGIRVVRTYADPGKSGLTFKNRPGLQRLLADITAGLADFAVILVYDVSRWGRFQDADESAYYEFLCRRASIRVEYCAEPFDNIPSPLTAVYKAIKRSMAAEYSREQSVRVFRGVSRIASLGHFSGGRPGYGYRRMLVSADGRHKGVLEAGVLRSIRSDYMVLVPGPRNEVVTVRRIFRLYVEKSLTPPQIADLLNDEGKTNSIGSRWHPQEISLILRSERYVGTLIYNRRSAKLRTRETENPEQSWIRVRGAHTALVSQGTFDAAQEIAQERGHNRHSRESLLAKLRHLWNRHGRLSRAIVISDGRPTIHAYARQFGGLRNAYAQIGYTPVHDYRDAKLVEHCRQIQLSVGSLLARTLNEDGRAVTVNRWRRSLVIDGAYPIGITTAKYGATVVNQEPFWFFRIHRTSPLTGMIVLLLNKASTQADEFLVLPRPIGPVRLQQHLHREDLEKLRAYRAPDIERATELLRAMIRSQISS